MLTKIETNKKIEFHSPVAIKKAAINGMVKAQSQNIILSG